MQSGATGHTTARAMSLLLERLSNQKASLQRVQGASSAPVDTSASDLTDLILAVKSKYCSTGHGGTSNPPEEVVAQVRAMPPPGLPLPQQQQSQLIAQPDHLHHEVSAMPAQQYPLQPAQLTPQSKPVLYPYHMSPEAAGNPPMQQPSQQQMLHQFLQQRVQQQQKRLMAQQFQNSIYGQTNQESPYAMRLDDDLFYSGSTYSGNGSCGSGNGGDMDRDNEYEEENFDERQAMVSATSWADTSIQKSTSAGTTLMIRNVPVTYTQEMLMEEWPNFGTYDFLYMPRGCAGQANLSYAFVNFTTPQAALDFKAHWQNGRLAKFRARKPLNISFADVQGVWANLQQLKKKRIRRIEMRQCQPYISINGVEVELAAALQLLKRS